MLEEVKAMLKSEGPSTITLHSLCQAFILSRQHLSPRTLEYYQTTLNNLQWYAKRQGWPEHAHLITREHIRQFLAYVARERNRWGNTNPNSSASHLASPATVHHYGNVIKNIFRWATDQEEYLPENPTARLKLGSPHYKEVEPYSDNEVLAMLDVCEEEFHNNSRFLGSRNRAIISVFVDTGLRLDELTSIRLSDLEPKLQRIRVMGKGTKMRVVPLENKSRRALSRYLMYRPRDSGDWVWLSEDGGPLAKRSIKNMVQRLKRRAGVRSGGCVHRFRHYFATRLLESGANPNSVRLLLGHETFNMVLHYTKYANMSHALREHQQFSPLDRLYRRQDRNNHSDWGWHY